MGLCATSFDPSGGRGTFREVYKTRLSWLLGLCSGQCTTNVSVTDFGSFFNVLKLSSTVQSSCTQSPRQLQHLHYASLSFKKISASSPRAYGFVLLEMARLFVPWRELAIDCPGHQIHAIVIETHLDRPMVSSRMSLPSYLRSRDLEILQIQRGWDILEASRASPWLTEKYVRQC